MSDVPKHEFTRGLYGWITHTDFASTDPAATRLVRSSPRLEVPTLVSYPAGDMHLFADSDSGGGGIRGVAPDESPGSTPTVHVEDTQVAYDAALAAGAEGVRPPTKIMDGVCIAMVRAPGGVLIGLSGPTG